MRFALSFAYFLISVHAICQGLWEIKSQVNGPPKSASTSFTLNNLGYIVGGMDEFEFKRKMYNYSPEINSWFDDISIGGLSGNGLQRASSTSFMLTLDNVQTGFVCLGQSQTVPYLNDLWAYDSETQSWSQKANFIGSPRRQAVSFVIDNYAYVGTGQTNEGVTNDFYRYNPEINMWEQLNDFPGQPRKQAVGLTFGQFGFIATGENGTMLDDCWLFDASSDTWILKADFPGGMRTGATGWASFPLLYVGTGENANFEYQKDFWKYNYFTNSWSQIPDLIGPPRKNAIAFCLNGNGYVGTGYNGEFFDDFYSYKNDLLGFNESEISFEIYPNPFINELTINNLAKIKILSIFSEEGQLIKTILPENDEKSFDLSELIPGVYFLVIHSENSVTTTKIIKSK
jgi:N-acetylneuraminic acid mutarotase